MGIDEGRARAGTRRAGRSDGPYPLSWTRWIIWTGWTKGNGPGHGAFQISEFKLRDGKDERKNEREEI